MRKGTWIGINQKGVFAALTNLDCEQPNRGRASRGLLVLECLHQRSSLEAVSEVVRILGAETYNAFNLVVADNTNMLTVIGYGSSRKIEIRHFEPGIHIATGWGVDVWDSPRCALIKRELGRSLEPPMRQLLTLHGNGSEEESVCVHKSDNHVTVSSCIISVGKDWKEVIVEHAENAPCLVTNWHTARMVL